MSFKEVGWASYFFSKFVDPGVNINFSKNETGFGPFVSPDKHCSHKKQIEVERGCLFCQCLSVLLIPDNYLFSKIYILNDLLADIMIKSSLDHSERKSETIRLAHSSVITHI